MRNDISLSGWDISAKSPGFADDFMESVFFCGNGRMGVRGYAAGEPGERPVQRGLFLAGIFDEIKPGMTDIVNLPTPVWHQISLNGMAGGLSGGVEYRLEMDTGRLTLQYTLAAGGVNARVREERFFDLQRPALLAQRLVLRCDNAASVAVCSGVLLASCNCPVPDDQVKESSETMKLTRMVDFQPEGDRLCVRLETKTTRLAVEQALRFCLPAGWQSQPFCQQDDCCGIKASGTAAAGQEVTFDKLCAITTSRDKDPLLAPLPAGKSYDALYAESKAAWQEKWLDCGISIQGDPASETALRYATYQLITNCSARDSSVSIGARGLTHTRYKGCYFWDTDLFLLPFYLHTCPQAARSLAAYRVNQLPQAKAHATKMNSEGARYPWMASYDGSEQCESWDIGASEVHVTADVVYALDKYVQNSKDDELADKAQDVYIEAARFWKSRYSPDGAGGVNLLFCKGPDEYCGITSNNLFTNVLVRHNVALAIRAANTLQADKGRWDALGLSIEEVQSWQVFHDAIKLPRDESGRLREDDSFHLLEPVDPKTLKPGDSASYHNVCFDRLQRYKVIKQADVLLLLSRLPALFSEKEKRQAWEDFEPLCLHDSTLSFASHALFAAQNGYMEPAWRYFCKALMLDLTDLMDNTGHEGLHLACFGEVWQTAVFGFGGLKLDAEAPVLTPNLPKGWQAMRFRFFWRGKRYQANINSTGATIENLQLPSWKGFPSPFQLPG